MYKRLKKPFLSKNLWYIFVDTEEGLSNKELLRKHFRIDREMRSKEFSPYCIKFIKFHESKTKEFEEIMKNLETKMTIFGYRDYKACAQKIFGRLGL